MTSFCLPRSVPFCSSISFFSAKSSDCHKLSRLCPLSWALAAPSSFSCRVMKGAFRKRGLEALFGAPPRTRKKASSASASFPALQKSPSATTIAACWAPSPLSWNKVWHFGLFFIQTTPPVALDVPLLPLDRCWFRWEKKGGLPPGLR